MIRERWVRSRRRLYRVSLKLHPVKVEWIISQKGRDRETIVEARKEHKASALVLERIIDAFFGVHIPHNRTHGVMKEIGLARDEPRKQMMRKWVRHERK